jgi:hypothetical protein
LRRSGILDDVTAFSHFWGVEPSTPISLLAAIRPRMLYHTVISQ